jgi:hypothetical protein
LPSSRRGRGRLLALVLATLARGAGAAARFTGLYLRLRLRLWLWRRRSVRALEREVRSSSMPRRLAEDLIAEYRRRAEQVRLPTIREALAALRAPEGGGRRSRG